MSECSPLSPRTLTSPQMPQITLMTIFTKITSGYSRIPHHVLSVRTFGHPGQDMEALGPSPHSHILSPRASWPSWQQRVDEASVDQGHICLRAGCQGDSCTPDNGDL